MVTNNYNLPQHIVDLVQNDAYTYTPHRYSVTEILNSTKEIILKRRHINKIIVDVSDNINMLFGSAFHKLMETGADNEEVRLSHEVLTGVTLSGIADVIVDGAIEDYKTCSVWKVKSKDFTDWEKQALMYAWLAKKNGYYIDTFRVIAFMKDFSQGRKEFDPLYPESAIYVHEIRITTDAVLAIEKFIIERLTDIEAHLNTPDHELPQPSDAELWKQPDVFAVFKTGGKRALKLYDTLEDAEAHVNNDFVNFRIDHRVGVYKKLEYSKELQQLWAIAESSMEELPFEIDDLPL